MVTRVATAVRRDLRAIAKTGTPGQAVAKSGLAAAALVLAGELDETRAPSIAIDALRQIVEEAEDDHSRHLAFVALERIDRRPGSSPSEKAQLARALLATMDRIHELAPEEAAGSNRLDELLARRTARLAG